ncbi:MFS transporter [Streptomyces gilvus]|uniref:MFS transporter n=1 Tax=Streptomyces gilvus TaxID=2920937 RepID=UPI001F108F8D|nr:MFS transporter [Streptomyces sp. CME 23]MCH5674427.1 MFS transporter [Streptomyces sp. CME 23]
MLEELQIKSEARVRPPRSRADGVVTRRRSAVFLSGVLTTFLVASSAPTPLYRVYRASWHFSSVTVTVIYGVYCLSVLVSLLTVGSLSDHLGRRPVIGGALALEALSMLLFLQAGDVTSLILARALQGLATGAATSALGAALLDVAKRWGALFVSIAPLLGMALGTLGTSLLMDLVPAHLGSVYILLFSMMTLQTFGLAFLPESRPPRPGGMPSLRPRIRAPRSSRRALLVTAPVFVAVWALGGFYLSLGPDLVQGITGSGSATADGLVVSLLTASAVPAVLLARGADAGRTALSGSLLLTSGVAVTLLAVHQDSRTALYVGTAVAGAGFGPAFQGGVRLVTANVLATERAGLMSAIYTITYTAMCVPVLVAGLLVNEYGLLHCTLFFGLFVIALSLAPFAALGKFSAHSSRKDL